MGTHPIFESDFDCLTERMRWLFFLLGSAIAQTQDVESATAALIITEEPIRRTIPEEPSIVRTIPEETTVKRTIPAETTVKKTIPVTVESTTPSVIVPVGNGSLQLYLTPMLFLLVINLLG